MTEPLNPVQQDELLQLITKRLLFDLPTGWNHLQIDYKSLGDHVEVGGLLRMFTGGMYGWDLPDEVHELFARLHIGMASPERGTWLHATYWLGYPDSYEIEYNRHNKPMFRTPPPTHAYVRELEIFPRANEHIPDWLRAVTD